MIASISLIFDYVWPPLLGLVLLVAPVVYAARKLPWVPVPVAPIGILASMFFSWLGLAVVVIFHLEEWAIYRIVLRNRAAAKS